MGGQFFPHKTRRPHLLYNALYLCLFFMAAVFLLGLWKLAMWRPGDEKKISCNCPESEPLPVARQIDLPVVYIITPTYSRPVQKAELTRLAQTLRSVPSLHWILVEDSSVKTRLVANLLKRSGVTSYTHLNIPTPKNYKITEKDRSKLPEIYRKKSKDISWLKPRGVEQRNLALDWIKDNVEVSVTGGVVYFADDDNTYDLRLFEEMRYTQRVSVWPVGLVGGLMVEKPLLNKNGKVDGWLTMWKKERPFAVDMAGFAVNLNLLLKHPEARFNIGAPRGYQESVLLQAMINVEDLEPKANNLTQVLVWHTRTEQPKLTQEETLMKHGRNSDAGMEV